MFTTAILSIALGFAADGTDPVQPAQRASAEDVAAKFEKSINEDGTVELRGFDRVTGKPFRFTIRKDGDVRGRVGERVVSFRVSGVE